MILSCCIWVASDHTLLCRKKRSRYIWYIALSITLQSQFWRDWWDSNPQPTALNASKVAVCIFNGAGWESRTLVSSLARKRSTVELTLHKQQAQLTVKNLLAATTNEINVTKPCESFNSQLINVVGAPTGNCTPTTWMETTSSAIKL